MDPMTAMAAASLAMAGIYYVARIIQKRREMRANGTIPPRQPLLRRRRK